MKKSIAAILISATLVVSIMVAACGPPSPVMPAAFPANEVPSTEARVDTLVGAGRVTSATDEERLTAVQSSIGILVAYSLEHGQVVSEDVFDTMQAMDQAREALRQLDGQQAGLGMLVAQYAAMGTSPPERVFDEINRVEQARSEAPKAVGLE